MITLQPVQDVSSVYPVFHFEGVRERPDSLLPASLLAAELQLFELVVPFIEFLIELLDGCGIGVRVRRVGDDGVGSFIEIL